MKAYIMGNYTEKAFQGFLKDPKSDRKAAVEQLTKAMGGTMHSMDIVRGPYDFIVVNELTSFEDFAATKLVVEASGAVKNLTLLEAIDFTLNKLNTAAAALVNVAVIVAALPASFDTNKDFIIALELLGVVYNVVAFVVVKSTFAFVYMLAIKPRKPFLFLFLSV